MTAVLLSWHNLCSSDCSGRSSGGVLVPVWLGCSALLVSGEAFHSCEKLVNENQRRRCKMA